MKNNRGDVFSTLIAIGAFVFIIGFLGLVMFLVISIAEENRKPRDIHLADVVVRTTDGLERRYESVQVQAGVDMLILRNKEGNLVAGFPNENLVTIEVIEIIEDDP